MKKEFFILFYDTVDQSLVQPEKITIELTDIEGERGEELVKSMAERYADERIIDLDAGLWTIEGFNKNFSNLTSVIVGHLELCNFVPKWGTLEEIVVEYLCGWTQEPVGYISSRYEISISQTEKLIEELRKFSKYTENGGIK